MQLLRTPDERFADLPDFPYEPHAVEVDDGDGGRSRVAYVDEGPPGGPTVLLLYGEPSWSFLYRRMIPLPVGAGLRVVAPDLVGFGRSDKPAERSDDTYARRLGLARRARPTRDRLRRPGLGGPIGLRLVEDVGPRFAQVVADSFPATPRDDGR